MKTVYIKENVYENIMGILGKEKPELGGMLGFSEYRLVIDRFVFDRNATVTSVEYNPDTEFLSDLLNNEWKASGTSLAGFVHSHPGDFNRLSGADVEYACRIMERFDIPFLFMPIVTSSYEYRRSLTGYIVDRSGQVEKCNVAKSACQTQEIDDSLLEVAPERLAEIEAAFAKMKDKEEGEGEPTLPQVLSQDDTFARIRQAIDIEYMGGCTVIGIGCGGARSFYESMARMGCGHFVLVDGDSVSRSNIASQNGYLSEVGKHKPEVIRNRLLDINEDVRVDCHNVMLDDGLDDAWVEKELLGTLDPKRCLLCAFTDSFHAQARASRIAVKYGIPFLAGQHHREGETSELIFWYPGVTRYSGRDILIGRYKAYKEGFKNDVTSAGSPIFNTTRLNALCEKIAVGMLLYGKDPMTPYCRFLSCGGDKNLLLIRQRFLVPGGTGLGELFPDDGTHLFDDTVWLNPEVLDEGLPSARLESDLTIEDTRDVFEGID